MITPSVQLWTISNIQSLSATLRNKIVFYAPLIDSLDFFGIDPVTFTRNYPGGRWGKDGLLHATGANVPQFDYDITSRISLGLYLANGGSEMLQYAAANDLDNAGGTVIWFEDRVPKSTGSFPNPFNASSVWTGNHNNVHVSHIVKTSSVLTAVEINAIQSVLLGVVEEVVAPTLPPPPIPAGSSFVDETPSGARNGVNTVFTLSYAVDLTWPVWLMCFGGACEKVASDPGEMEFTLSGSGNRTLTMGLGPTTDYPFKIKYLKAA